MSMTLIQSTIVGCVNHSLAGVEINLNTAVLLATCGAGVVSYRLRTTLTGYVLQLSGANTTALQVSGNALHDALPIWNVDTVITGCVSVTVNINVALVVIFQYGRELCQFAFALCVEHRLVGGKENTAVECHLNSLQTVSVGYFFNFGVLYLGCSFGSDFIHVATNDGSGTGTYGGFHGCAHRRFACYLTNNASPKSAPPRSAE